MQFFNNAINETVKSTVLVDELNLWELPEKCECGFPMHLASGGTIAFCPPCKAKKEQALSGREALDRLKARIAAGTNPPMPTFEERHAAEQADRDQVRGPFRFGMPL